MKQIFYKYRDIIVVSLSLAFSLILGIIAKDIILSLLCTFTALMGFYFAARGNKINYLFEIVNYVAMAYFAFKNHLFGTFSMYVFICIPLNIAGFITWKNNTKEDDVVAMRKFDLKTSAIVVSLCLVSSVLLGYILSLIPTQQMSFLDASSNCINIAGVILFNLRYIETWYVWLVNNILDMVIWTIVLVNGGPGSIIMFVTALVYLLLNFYGIINWFITIKKENKKNEVITD